MAVTEEANVDEATTAEAKASKETGIYLEEERNKQSYKETMNIVIENISTFGKRNKACKTQLSTTYEAIEPDLLNKYDTFPDDFLKNARIMQMKLIIYHLR